MTFINFKHYSYFVTINTGLFEEGWLQKKYKNIASSNYQLNASLIILQTT